jgi:hypothetical protein
MNKFDVPRLGLVLFVICLVVMALLSPPTTLCADDKSPRESDLPLYPLKKGLKWGIEVDDKFRPRADASGFTVANEKKEGTMEVTEIVMVDKLACYQVQDTDSTDYICMKDDGCVYQVGFAPFAKNNFGMAFIYDPPLCILKPANKKLQTWDIDSTRTIGGFTEKDSRQMCGRFKGTAVQYNEKLKGFFVKEYKEYETVRVSIEGTFERKDSGLKTKIKIDTWYVPGKGPIKYQSYEEDRNSPVGKERIVYSFSGEYSMAVGDVVLNPTDIEKEASSESIEVPPGVVTEFKKSRTIKRELTYSTKLNLGAELENKLGTDLYFIKGRLAAKVKGSIEAAMGETLSDSETREITVKIDGKEIPKGKIIWIDVYKTGTIEVTQDGKPYKIPFEFPVGTKLIVRKQ